MHNISTLHRDMPIEKDRQTFPCFYLQEVKSCIELHIEIVNVFLSIAILVFMCSNIHRYKDFVYAVCAIGHQCLSACTGQHINVASPFVSGNMSFHSHALHISIFGMCAFRILWK